VLHVSTSPSHLHNTFPLVPALLTICRSFSGTCSRFPSASVLGKTLASPSSFLLLFPLPSSYLCFNHRYLCRRLPFYFPSCFNENESKSDGQVLLQRPKRMRYVVTRYFPPSIPLSSTHSSPESAETCLSLLHESTRLPDGFLFSHLSRQHRKGGKEGRRVNTRTRDTNEMRESEKDGETIKKMWLIFLPVLFLMLLRDKWQ